MKRRVKFFQFLDVTSVDSINGELSSWIKTLNRQDSLSFKWFVNPKTNKFDIILLAEYGLEDTEVEK